ncbi:MAG: rhodanese-like domain-containing protein [Gemmatimonadales bacterium]
MMPTTIDPIVSSTDLAEALTGSPGIRVLDVRTAGEYESAHIAGAYNVPLDALAEHAAELRSVREPVVLVCQSGQRARQAEAALQGAGMADLHVLDGGMNGWISAGRPAVRGPRRISLERQVRIVAGSLSALGGVLALGVSPWSALPPAAIGSGLVFSGVTDTCGMGLVLARLPYNRPASCDVPSMVRAFASSSAV